MAQTVTIGHVAKVTGVAAKTIRYYEEIGVLPTPTRAPSPCHVEAVTEASR